MNISYVASCEITNRAVSIIIIEFGMYYWTKSNQIKEEFI